MVKFKFRLKGKERKINVRVLSSSFSQALGLMFGFNKRSLLFVFKNKKKRSIHSFFCKPFIAIWFDGEKIVDSKLVGPWRLSVKPDKKFDKLLEIPSGTREFLEFNDGKV